MPAIDPDRADPNEIVKAVIDLRQSGKTEQAYALIEGLIRRLPQDHGLRRMANVVAGIVASTGTLLEKIYDLRAFPSSLLHVGANDGDEADLYRRCLLERVLYVEPLPAAFATLNARIAGLPGHRAVQALCSDTDGETVDFNVSSNKGASSSMFPLGYHASVHKDITYTQTLRMTTTTVDTLTAGGAERFDVLLLDVQGAEMKVLRGAPRTLANARAVIAEVCEVPLYEGACTFDEVVDFLKPLGFRLKKVEINILRYGDAIFVRG